MSAKRQIEETHRFVGAPNTADARLAGELQRLAILQVLLADPAFIFAADVQTRSLEPEETMTLLVQTAHECGVLFVSHDRELVARVADRAIHRGARA